MSLAFKSGFLYFLLVFTIGFILGTIRVLYIVPLIGERAAELIEMPIMLAVTFYAAGYVTKRFEDTLCNTRHSLTAGIVAFLLLICFECSVVWMQDKDLHEYLSSRDPIAFTVYITSILLYLLMPWIICKRKYYLTYQ